MGGGGVHISPKMWEPPQISRCQKGEMKHVPILRTQEVSAAILICTPMDYM